MQTNRWIAIAVLGIVALVAPTAWSDPVYRFQFDGFKIGGSSVPLTQLTNTSWTVSLLPGDTFSVNVYLYEDMSGGGTSVLNTGGLQDAGLRLTRTSPTTGSATLTGITANATDFNDAGARRVMSSLAQMKANGYSVDGELDPYGPPYTMGGLRELVDIFNLPNDPNGALGTAFGTSDYRILLGTFEFTAGGTIGIDTVMQAADLSSSDETTEWPTGNPIDTTIGISPSTLIVSVVPEPPSLVTFLGLVLSGGALGWLHLRRRRAALAVSRSGRAR